VVDVFNSGNQTLAANGRRSLLQTTLPTITIRFEISCTVTKLPPLVNPAVDVCTPGRIIEVCPFS
jgi:hypothetical protein